MGVTGPDIEGRHIPDQEAGVACLQVYVLPIAGNMSMVDQEICRNHRRARWPPTAANVSGLSVVPTAAELLIIHNREGAVAGLAATCVDLYAIFVGRNREVATGDARTRHQRWLHS